MSPLRALGLLACMSLAACGAGTSAPLRYDASLGVNPNAPPTTIPTQPGTPPPQAAGSLAFVGRTLPMEAGNPMHVRFSWATVQVGMHFTGTGISASLNDIPATYMGHSGNAYYDIQVDGALTTNFHSTVAPTTYTLAQNLPMGEHTVWLSKRTESMIGSSELHGVAVENGQLLAPPAPATRRIEVIGASADVGYGADATNCSNYQDFQENGNKAWPAVAGQQLKAEVHNLSCSGKGIIANIDGSTDGLLPAVYGRADFNDASGAWAFDSWKPDAVVLDNGSNDRDGSGGTLGTNFVSAYVAYIKTIAGHYPQAAIYVVVNATQTGAPRATLVTTMQQVVSQAQAAGVTGARYFEFPQYTGGVFGCDGHPSADLHATMGQEIAAQIAKDLSWN